MTETLYTSAQVAAKLGCSRATVDRVARDLSIGTRYGNARLYSAADIAAIAARNTRSGNPTWLPGTPQPHRKRAAKQARAKKIRRRRSLRGKAVTPSSKKS